MRASAVSAPTRVGPHHQATAGVDGGADDPVAGADLDRHALAGQHRGVDGRAALDDHAVGGDLLAGPDHEQVAGRELVDRHAALHAAHDATLEHGHVLGTELEEGPERGTGPALGPRLEVATGEQEHRDGRGDLEVELVGAGRPRQGQLERHRHARLAGVAEEQRDRGPAERGRRRRARSACPSWPWRGGGSAARRGGTATRPTSPPARPARRRATASCGTAAPGSSTAAPPARRGSPIR